MNSRINGFNSYSNRKSSHARGTCGNQHFKMLILRNLSCFLKQHKFVTYIFLYEEEANHSHINNQQQWKFHFIEIKNIKTK